MVLDAVQTQQAAAQAARLFDPQSLAWLVFLGAALATLVASLMAEEQNQRLRQGVFGATAGSAVGAVASLLTKEDSLVVVGFVGSVLGAFVGWVCSLLLSLWAAKTETGRTVLEYQVGGWLAVRKKLVLDNDRDLLDALNQWIQSFTRRATQQKEDILRLPASDETNAFIQIVLQEWLMSFVDTLGLLFQIAKKEAYRSRVTIIVFGKRGREIVGKHWTADAGSAQSHNMQMEFDTTSIGYQILTGTLGSPYFATVPAAGQQGQDRKSKSYRPFLSFRVDARAVLAIDWPNDLPENDEFVGRTRDIFHQDLVPAVGQLLAHWHGPLAKAVELDPL